MQRRKDGFTLVELLVVIGIIAILMSVLLPVLSRVRENANRVACLSNVRQVSTAIFMYTEENHRWFPCIAVYGGPSATALGYGNATTPAPSGWPADWIGWPEDWIIWRNKKPTDVLRGSIVKYLGNPSSGRIMMCPSDDSNWRRITNADGTIYPYSYVMNAYLSYGTNQNPDVPATVLAPKNNLVYKNDAAWKITQVRKSADTILIYEADERSLQDGRGQLQSPAVGTNAANIIMMLSIRHDAKRRFPDDVPDPLIHGTIAPSTASPNGQINKDRSGNVGFVDGHAEYVNRLFAHDRAITIRSFREPKKAKST